jgi:hypothetical protein
VVHSIKGPGPLTLHEGTGRTTPGVDAFRDASLQKQVWGIRNYDAPALNDSVTALPRLIAMQSLLNRRIADKTANIAPYVGTAAAARDMLSIVEAQGQGSFLRIGYGWG